MKRKGALVNGSIMASLVLLVGGMGVIAAYRTFMVYDIPWQRHPLPAPPGQTTNILLVDLQSYGNYDPTGDTIYVTTRDGTVYAHTLFEDQWLPGEPADRYDDSSWCVAPGPPSAADVWEPDAPPVEKKVLASAGWLWGSGFTGNATILRCYVLYRDGSLEVWTRQKNSLSPTDFAGWASAFGGCGALVGAVIGGVILAIRHSAKARAAPTPFRILNSEFGILRASG